MTGFMRFGLAVLAIGLMASLALAGPNATGVLQIHVSDAAYSAGQDYAHQSGIECEEDFLPCPPYDPSVPCAVTGVAQENAAVGEAEPFVFYVMAAFSDGSCPRVKAVTFALQYDPAVFSILESSKVADFEVVTTNGDGESWPATNSGTGLTFNSPKTSHLFEIYWFAGVMYYTTGTTVQVIGHRTQGATFADNSVPAIVDPVHALSVMGVGTGVGENPDPNPTVETTWGWIKSTYQN